MLQPADLLAYVRGVHDRTYEAVALLDDESVDWRPREGEFTCGELVAHIAASRAMNVRSVCGEATRYEGHELPPLAGWNFVRRLAEHSSTEALRKLERADLSAEVTTISGARMPAWRLLIAGLIEHEVHHRSQLCEYLSMMGIAPPPLYGLHAEDLRRG
jgi:uncharacterized damage-inducible protein DinB